MDDLLRYRCNSLSGSDEKSGYTLVEVMIVMVIFSVLMGAIFGMLTTGRRVWSEGGGIVYVQNEAKRGMENILKELRLASSGVTYIDSEDANHNGIIDLGELGNAPDTILFSIPLDLDGDGNVDLDQFNMIVLGADDQAGWRIRFLRGGTSGNQLLREVTDQNGNVMDQRVMANHIGTLDFTNSITPTDLTAPDQVTITVTTRVTALEGRSLTTPLEATLTTKVLLRN